MVNMGPSLELGQSCLLCRRVELGWRGEECHDGGREADVCPISFTRAAFHLSRLVHFGAGGFVTLEIAFFSSTQDTEPTALP